MNPPEIYKVFGPTAFLIGWITIVLLIFKIRGNKSMSISKHAAASKLAYVIMLIMQLIVLPMFFVFAAKWLAPTFNLPAFFTVCIGIASLGLLIAALIPDTIGWKSTVHGLAGYGAALLFVPILTTLYLSASISSSARNIILLVLLYEMAAITWFGVVERAKNHHLYLQSAYIVLFDLSLLAAAYIR